MNAAAVRALARLDKTLHKLMQKVGPIRLQPNSEQSPYEALVESVAYQQLTGKAAATIFSRFCALYKEGKTPPPQWVLETSEETLRSAGLSRAKTLAIKDIAAKTVEGLVPSSLAIYEMEDAEIVERLTAIRGVGQWTVEMLLIFKLGRPDILPATDYGVRKGFAKTYRKKDLPTPKELMAFGERWRPHRTTAAWYLWRSLELEKSPGQTTAPQRKKSK